MHRLGRRALGARAPAAAPPGAAGPCAARAPSRSRGPQSQPEGLSRRSSAARGREGAGSRRGGAKRPGKGRTSWKWLRSGCADPQRPGPRPGRYRLSRGSPELLHWPPKPPLCTPTAPSHPEETARWSHLVRRSALFSPVRE